MIRVRAMMAGTRIGWANRCRRAAILLLGAGLLAGLAACTVNPATGDHAFTAFMSPSEEKAVGREEDPKIRNRFGGIYEHGDLARFVGIVGRNLARHTERPDQGFTFTLLNSPEVNAFALPGGYVYVTRGLLALAGSEAELAGVLAHEIGHVVARHGAQRYSHAVAAGLGAALLSAAVGNREFSDLMSAGADLYVKGYSRENEYEADILAVRYLARAGYDTGAMASFLARMHDHARMRSAADGGRGDPDRFSLLATHPRTIDRVRKAIAAAAIPAAGKPRRGTESYLRRLDGMLFGGDPAQGVIRGRRFMHVPLGIRFEVPADFTLVNRQSEVLAVHPGGARIVFDRDSDPPPGRMTAYLRDVWGRSLRLHRLEPLLVGGRDAAAATARLGRTGDAMDLRLVAVRQSRGSVLRFLFLTPPSLTAHLSPGLQQTVASLRRPDSADIAAARPVRLVLVRTGPGDSVTGLAARMAGMAGPGDPEKLFRVLNGLSPGQRLRSGQLVKLVLRDGAPPPPPRARPLHARRAAPAG